ncbi:hypothetical protein [Microbacterium sp. AK031]|uniref:hypothetical protein n=1 Tax=Microbacterium sp. AK031 TaxID=2723076 RepID=UPI00216861E5|nr:hypothetical protein [Microbacterium sp. AK031]MCS3843073.1 hypothetical protein [Microbacterium sp. AK031]
MLTILATTGRVLLRHWPALLAWFAAGALGHYLAIQLAGYVGAWSSTWGFVLLPLAILSKPGRSSPNRSKQRHLHHGECAAC